MKWYPDKEHFKKVSSDTWECIKDHDFLNVGDRIQFVRDNGLYNEWKVIRDATT